MGWGERLFQFAGRVLFFFYVHRLSRIFFRGQVPCTDFLFCFFWGGGGGGGGERGGGYSTVAILILTLATIWSPGTDFKQIFFNLSHSRFTLLSKLYSGGSIAKYQTRYWLLPDWSGCVSFFVWCEGKYQFYLFISLVITFILGMRRIRI